MIRNATIEDAKAIHSLLSYYAAKELLLGRSYFALYEKLRDFKVFVDKHNAVVGVCALHIVWEDLAEIRSLAVQENMQGKKIGKQLILSCLEDADHYNIDKVFTLTYQSDFFRKQGFFDIDKSQLPHKIWSDCLNCLKFPDCDEEAMQCSVKNILNK